MTGPVVSRSKVLQLITAIIILAAIIPACAAAGRYDRLLNSPAGKAKLEDLALMEDSRNITGIGKYVSDPDPLIRLRCAETLGRSGVALTQGLYIMLGTLLMFRVDWGDPAGAIAIVLLFAAVGSGAVDDIRICKNLQSTGFNV